jgi:beta-glucanase (GH16 family)
MPSQSRSALWTAIVIGVLLVASATLLVARIGHAVTSANSASSARSGSVTSSSSTKTPAASHSSSAPPVTATSALPPGHWTSTWIDSFNTRQGLKRWWPASANTGGKSEHELQWYDKSNATISNGKLVLTATKGGGGHTCWNGRPCQYSSARIQSYFDQEYGVFEARIKLPGGRGIWPAFWMQGDNYKKVFLPKAGEIDIVEVNGKQPADRLSGFAHAKDGHATDYYDRLPESIYDGYHVYGVEWTPKGISWYVDGKKYGNLPAYRGWVFNHPFNIILSLAVGGGWPGSPNASTQFPARMYVDWLRVYRQA